MVRAYAFNRPPYDNSILPKKVGLERPRDESFVSLQHFRRKMRFKESFRIGL